MWKPSRKEVLEERTITSVTPESMCKMKTENRATVFRSVEIISSIDKSSFSEVGGIRALLE